MPCLDLETVGASRVPSTGLAYRSVCPGWRLRAPAIAPLAPELGFVVFLTYVLLATLAAGVLMAKRDV